MPISGYDGSEYDPRKETRAGLASMEANIPQEPSALLRMCTEIHKEIDAVYGVLNTLKLKTKPITVVRNEPDCCEKGEGLPPCSPLMEGLNHARSRIRSLGIDLTDFMRKLEV